MLHCKKSMKNGIYRELIFGKSILPQKPYIQFLNTTLLKFFEGDELLNVSRNKVAKEELNGFCYWELENAWIVKKP